jgi:hypothetical protein
MGGRGRDSGLGSRQITLDNITERNIISDIISASAERRKLMSDGGAGVGGAGSSILLKKCACCGEYTIPVNTEYETCLFCAWIDDPFQNANPDSIDGRNPFSLNDAKEKYRKKKIVEK